MRDHQKYFALEDKQHALAPHFLAVLNTEVDGAGTAIIRHGNERVLRARFNDARFFWNYDQKIPLERAGGKTQDGYVSDGTSAATSARPKATC